MSALGQVGLVAVLPEIPKHSEPPRTTAEASGDAIWTPPDQPIETLKSPPRHGARLAIVAGAMLAALSTAITFMVIRATATSEQWVEHTIEARRQISELRSTVSGGSSAIAVYEATRRATDLGRYQSAVQTTPSQLAELAHFTSDNPVQRHATYLLKPLIAESFPPLGVDLPGSEPTEAWFRQHAQLMDGIYEIVTGMDLEERRLLAIRTSRANVQHRVAELISVLSLAFSLGLIGLGWWLQRLELTREIQLARLLNIGSRVSNTSSNFRECLQRTLDEVCAAMGWKTGHAHLLRNGTLVSEGLWRLPPGRDLTALQESIAGVEIAPGEGLAGRVMATRQPSWLHDVTAAAATPWHQKARAAVHDAGYRGMFALPVLALNSVPAVLEFFVEKPCVADPALFDVLESIGAQLGRVFERERSEGHREELMARLRTLNAELEERITTCTASLKEREVLLQEVHHRVKNNLQIIVSMINMQVRQMKEASAREALELCQMRIHAIALVHEKLYQSKDYARISFADYARSLAADVFQLTGTAPTRIHLEIDIPDGALTIDKAVPCGLILNELLTNAVKHAFPDTQPGRIRVELRPLDSQQMLLAVTDDGVGIPASFDLKESPSIGLQLITTLSEQLDGRLEIRREHGTTVQVSFPLGAS